MDKLIEKVKKLLSKHKVPEDTINAVVNDLNGEKPEDTPNDSNETVPPANDETTVDNLVPPVDEKPNGEDVPPVDTPDGEGAVNDGVVPPVATPDETSAAASTPNPVDTLPEGTTEVNPAEITPEDNVPPTNPEVPTPNNDAQYTELLTKVEEQANVIATLKSELSSLKDALVKGGIMEKETVGNSVGPDGSNLPANDPIDDPLSDVLNEINRGY